MSLSHYNSTRQLSKAASHSVQSLGPLAVGNHYRQLECTTIINLLFDCIMHPWLEIRIGVSYSLADDLLTIAFVIHDSVRLFVY